MTHRPKRSLYAATLAVALSGVGGCWSDRIDLAIDVDPEQWQTGVDFIVPNADSLRLHDALLFLRCNERMTDDTLSLRIVVTTPDALRSEEMVHMAVDRHSLPVALRRESVAPYRSRIRFARSGDYRFTVVPVRPIRGVEAVGLTVKPSS